MAVPGLAVVSTADLEEYPVSRDMRLDSHHFMAWEHRRWLNSSMRMKGTPECKSIYFDLICAAFGQSPVGTLPDDPDQLAKLALVPESHFRALCQLEYGPLHLWRLCLSEGERRLYHPQVLRTVTEAVARKEDNRARNEAANASKRRERLRVSVAGYSADLSANDAAILWMDEWLTAEGCGYRAARWIERAIEAWSAHMMALNLTRRAG